MAWVLRGLRDGVTTSHYPRRADPYEQEFLARVRPLPADPGAVASNHTEEAELEGLCPTSAIHVEDGAPRIDTGRCVLCGRCVRARPDRFEWAPGSETATVLRQALVVPQLPETNEAVEEVRNRLAERTRRLRRSVHIRHIDVGSDGSEEWEVLALLNPIYDVHRLGIFFAASPRHADILLVTGAGAHGMAGPLRRTIEAMPRPLVVIAAGVDAISGGLIAPTYAVDGGIHGRAEGLAGSGVSVDVWVPGSPPSPFSLLHALLLAVGRINPKGR